MLWWNLRAWTHDHAAILLYHDCPQFNRRRDNRTGYCLCAPVVFIYLFILLTDCGIPFRTAFRAGLYFWVLCDHLTLFTWTPISILLIWWHFSSRMLQCSKFRQWLCWMDMGFKYTYIISRSDVKRHRIVGENLDFI